MDWLLGLLAVALFVRAVILIGRKDSSSPISPVTKTAVKPAKQVYQGSQDDFIGEGSDLIRKFANKPSAQEQALIDQACIESIDGQEKRSNGRRQRKSKKLSVTGSISFDYLDIDLNCSSRVVDVTQIDDRHFSGYCRSARAFRTFRVTGVQSDVTDTDTGEVMPIEDWIENASLIAPK